MAYAFDVSDPLIETIKGRKHITYTITETDVSGADSDEWSIDVPKWGQVVLLEVERTDPDAAATLDPELGTAASFDQGTNAALFTNGTAAAHVRSQSPLNYYAPTGKLYGRSEPDAHANTLTTRITLLHGITP